MTAELQTKQKDIFIEVAYFTPENIRRTGKKLGITSEQIQKRKRVQDIENVPEFLDRVSESYLRNRRGNIVGKAKDVYVSKYQK